MSNILTSSRLSIPVRLRVSAIGQRLLLSAAIGALVCTTAAVQSAYAQASVTGTGDITGGAFNLPSWTTSNDITIGDTAIGGLDIENGGVVNSGAGGAAFVGNQTGGNGTVTVSGTDGHGNASTWTNNGDLVIGQDGTGKLIISNGGQVSNATGYIGAGGTAADTVEVSGVSSDGLVSTWTNAGQLNIGDNGAGSLIIQGGGVVSTQQNAVIGLDSSGLHTGVGTVTVSGTDNNGHASTLNVAFTLSVGDDTKNNTLDIENGGVVNSGAGTIGDVSVSPVAGTGTVTVSGRDANGNASTWNSGNIYAGYLGTGTLNISDGGIVNSSGGGGGAASVYIGYGSGTTGVVTVSSSTSDISSLSSTDRIEVGVQGTGTLNIEKGGLVHAGSDTYVTDASGSTGTLNLLGDASGRGVLETGSVINGNGAGILVFNGGILRATRDESNFLNNFAALPVGAEGAWFDTNGYNIAVSTAFSGSSSFNKQGLGTLTLTGASTYTGQTNVTAGELQIAAGGQINGTASVFVDTGSLTVTGAGSLFNTPGDLILGRGTGTAAVTVADGGHLTTGRSFIGEGGAVTTATALSATVTGPGSIWDAGDGFFLGAASGSAPASLMISNGGVMRAQSTVAYSTIGIGGVATATVTDANSQLVVGGSTPLAIGELARGAGTLTIANGGLVIAPTVLMGAFDANASGVLNIDGTPGAQGVLQTASLTKDAGSGTVIFDGGVLRATADGTAFISGFNAGDITIGAGGAFIDSNGFSVTASSALTGAGALTKLGAGVLTLTGTNSYTGGTSILDGTLIGSAASFGTGTILDNAALVIDQPADGELPGAINGNGTFLKQGAGRLNLTGGGNFSGPVTVAAGTLSVNGALPNAVVTVNSGATLGGNGTVGATTVQTGATIAPGNSIGTLHINGAYTQAAGSVYQVQVDPNTNASDLILVNGAATLASGAGLSVSKAVPGDYKVGTVYTVLTTTNGVTGTYTLSGDTALSSYLGLKDTYDANHAYLTITQTGDPGDAATTPNQTETATGTGSLPSTGSVGSAVLNTPDPVTTRSAFDALSGEALASAKSALVSGSLLLRDTTFDRLRDVFCASVSDEQRRANNRTHNASCLPRADKPAVWMQGFGSWGHTGGNGNAAALSQSTGGFLVGVDVPVYDWRIGYFGGFSRTDFDVKARNSSGNSNNYHLGTYAGTQWGDLGLRLGASYSWNGLATDRSVTVGALQNDLRANYNAGTTQVFGELGNRFGLGQVTLEPFANVAYVNLRTDGFSETGGDAALTAKADTMEDTFTTLGVRPSTDISWGSFDATARGMAGWRHAFGDVTPSSTVSFAGSDTFTVTGVPIAEDAGVVEAGLDFVVHDNVTAGITYGGQFSSRETDHSIRGNLAITF